MAAQYNLPLWNFPNRAPGQLQALIQSVTTVLSEINFGKMPESGGNSIMARQLIFISMALLAAQVHGAEPGHIIFVAGQAEVEGDPARVGGTVRDGDRVRTGGDGYLYIRTPDQRLVIVRPETETRFARELANPAPAALIEANAAKAANAAVSAGARFELPAMAGAVFPAGANPDLDARKNDVLQARLPQLGAAGTGGASDFAGGAQVVSWGRWEKVIDRAPNVILENLAGGAGTAATSGTRRLASNEVYVLMRGEDGAPYQAPVRGSAGFALAASEAYVRDAGTGQRTAATLADGRLTVDFTKATFATSVDVRDQDASYRLSGAGRVGRDGQFGSPRSAQPGTMQVDGALGGNGGATYLFEGALTPTRTVSGVATWRPNPPR